MGDESNKEEEEENKAGVEGAGGSEGNVTVTEDVEMMGPGEVAQSAEVAEDDGRLP